MMEPKNPRRGNGEGFSVNLAGDARSHIGSTGDAPVPATIGEAEHKALDNLLLRIGRTTAIANALSGNDDTPAGEAWRGVTDMLDDIGARLDAILYPQATGGAA